MKNPITTVTGVVLILLSILTLVGVITSDQAVELAELVAIVIEAVAGGVALFAKDKGGGL